MSRMDNLNERQLLAMEQAANYLERQDRRRPGPEWVAVLTALVFVNLALLLMVCR